MINFIISFFIFTFVFLVNGIFKTLPVIIKGASFLTILKIFYFFFLSSIPYILPLTILSASTSIFSRLTYDREIHIFSFSGINPLILIKSLISFSLICSLFLVYYNLYFFPSVKYKGRKVIYNLKVKNPLSIFHPRTIINDFPNFSIYIGDLSRDMKFKNLSIIQKQKEIIFFIKAKKGKIKYIPETNSIIFIMEDGFLISQQLDKITKLDFSEYKFNLNLPESFSVKNPRKKISELTFSELKKKKDIRYKVEMNKKIMFGITPLIFIFLGGGIGLKLKSKSRVLNIGVAGAISLLFFSIMIVGEITSRKLNFAGFVYLPAVVFSGITYYFLKWLK